MKLDVIVNGAPESMQLLAPPPACRFQLGDGPIREANVESPEPCVYSVLLDGRSYEARVEERPDSLIVVIDGYRFEIEVRDPRRWSRKGSAAGAAGIQTVTAPMPGKVVRVLVAAGETVQHGQGIAVIEAMKMQNEMKSPRAGKILTLPTKEGATVAAGEILATIE
jgi:biotin carboxyl carrier protein